MDPIDAGLAEQVGQTIAGRWTLRRLIGSGGMAAVYAAESPDGRVAAMKLLYPEMARRRDIRERFLREASVMARIVHPGMVSIYEQGQTPDQAYLVMELLTGETVAARVRRLGRLEPREVLVILDQVLDVLSLAHSMGVVHRDLKPENLFLTQENRVKVLDFGLARLLDCTDEAFRTRTGAALGTLPYMAPEQALGRRDEVDARTDLFALGATAFRLLTGRRIHEAPSEAELLMCMASQPAPPLAKAAPDLPADLGAVVDRALAFAKTRRYPEAQTMQRDVRALLAGERPEYALSCWEREEFPTVPPARRPRVAEAAPSPPDSTRPLEVVMQQPRQPAVAPTAVPAPADETQPDLLQPSEPKRPLPATVVMPASVRSAATVTESPVLVQGATIPTAPISDIALERNRRRTLRTAVFLLVPLFLAIVAGTYGLWLASRSDSNPSASADLASSQVPGDSATSPTSTQEFPRIPLRHPANPISPLDEPPPGLLPPHSPHNRYRGAAPSGTPTKQGAGITGSLGNAGLAPGTPMPNLVPTPEMVAEMPQMPLLNPNQVMLPPLASGTSAAPATASHPSSGTSSGKPSSVKKPRHRSTNRH